MKNTLLIFIRNPQLGKVKTRLAQTLGDEEALRIYQILLKKTRSAALACEAERYLFYSDFVDEQDDWAPAFFQKKIQHRGDLGARMESAFQQTFESGAKKVIIIGSDCPELSGETLQQAFDLLDTADFVLGPVPDGGYYLLGMKALESSVFHNIEWSTETVRAKTIEKILAVGKSYALLPILSDVDTEEDWRGLMIR
ncbi:MAG: TIGR04282 family arsenosugar biosynthesis glycosyltransferase [Lewinellaceae bacterium]|nr:TIGR04282 family arsenosugar biosynthesis glycosyltransferase [Lewinellaceae bacterium]